jgi:hypothetical protein
MQGLLSDVHLQGHLRYLDHLLRAIGLWPVLSQLGIRLATFRDLGIPGNIDDRSLWKLCQEKGWVLFTEDRNNDGPDSLHATLLDSWQTGGLPVLTLANKGRFEHDRVYTERAAMDIANLLFDIADGQYRDQARIWVPL